MIRKTLFFLILNLTTFSLPLSLLAQDEEIWFSSLSAARKEAEAQDKLIFVEFGAEWSIPNVKLAAEVWSDERVIEKLNNYIPVYQDLEVDKVSTYQYQISVVPTLLILESNGQEVLRIKEAISKIQMNELLDIAKEAFQPIIELNKTYRDFSSRIGYFLYGEAFQELGIQLPISIRSFFLKQSKNYLKKIAADPSETARELNEKIKIRKMINRAWTEPIPEQYAKRLEKRSNSSKLSEENQALALYGAILCNYRYAEKATIEKLITRLEMMPHGTQYVRRLEHIGVISITEIPE